MRPEFSVHFEFDIPGLIGESTVRNNRWGIGAGSYRTTAETSKAVITSCKKIVLYMVSAPNCHKDYHNPVLFY